MTEPTNTADLHALFDVGRMRAAAGIPAAVLDRAAKGTPIKELFS